MKNTELHNPDDYIVIPNPIYDVVFKYLMEDNQSAKIILSTLINENIKKLTFAPVSHSEKIQDPTNEKMIKLFHLDFTAVIEKSDGKEELIMIELQKANNAMIELQKANNASDIFRFKRYISANFQQKQEEEVINPRTKEVEKIYKPIRLIPIFILNFRIENEINDLIIKTSRDKIGIFKGIILQKENEFIDNLSYDIWVVQLPNLNKIEEKDYRGDEYKTKLYQLLKLFDQDAQTKTDRHRLMIIKKLFPEFLERVINRLKSADADNPDLEEQMNVEDEYLTELMKKYNEISYFKQKLDEERKLSKEKDKIILDFARILKNSGKSIAEIQELTNLSSELIENL